MVHSTNSNDCVNNHAAASIGCTPSEFVAKELACTWQWRIDTDPELAAMHGLLSQRQATHSLDPRSLKSFDERVEWVQTALQRIKDGISPEQVEQDLTKEERLSYELYVEQLSDYATYTPKYRAYLCCVNRLEGPQISLPLYASYLSVKTPSDRLYYRDFLKAIPQQLDEVTELLKCGVQEKRTPAQVSLGCVVDQIRDMMQSGLNTLYDPIKDAFVLPDEQSLKEECEGLIDGVVMDAFGSLVNYLETEYIPNIRTEISATKGYPDGESYYKDCLKFHTTTSMTAEEIHTLGLDELQRVQGEMETIASFAGYKGRLKEYFNHLRRSTEFDPKSSSWLLTHYRDLIARIYPSLLKLFHLHTLPRQPLDVSEMPLIEVSTSTTAHYSVGSSSVEAPRPGKFHVNTSKLRSRRTYYCEALALHEGLPGRHLQGSIQQDPQSHLPSYRRFHDDRRYFESPGRFPSYAGYIEGWAAHCETLGKELGLYNQELDEIGHLAKEAVRCCRLIVDTGVNGMDWSKGKATQFIIENTTLGVFDANAELIRCISWPGQATASTIGERHIRNVRLWAEAEVSDRFDVRDFYEVVLRCGPVPLATLQYLVQGYVETNRRIAPTEEDPWGSNNIQGNQPNTCRKCNDQARGDEPDEQQVKNEGEEHEEEEGDVDVQLCLPKRKLLNFFNDNAEARKIRLDGKNHEKISKRKKQCISCYKLLNGRKWRAETTVMCSKCGVYLCTRKKLLPSGNRARLSCWQRHHTQPTVRPLRFISRNEASEISDSNPNQNQQDKGEQEQIQKNGPLLDRDTTLESSDGDSDSDSDSDSYVPGDLQDGVQTKNKAENKHKEVCDASKNDAGPSSCQNKKKKDEFGTVIKQFLDRNKQEVSTATTASSGFSNSKIRKRKAPSAPDSDDMSKNKETMEL